MMRISLWLLVLTLALSVAPAQQANQPSASMILNGVSGPPYPITTVTFPRGLSSTLLITGQPFSIFLVGGSPSLATTSVPFSGGLVDLNLASFFMVLNGLQDPIFFTDGTGAFSASLPIPSNATIGTQAAFQALVADVTSSFGATLTAASLVTIGAGVTTQPIVLGDDNFVNFNLAPYGITLPYYSQSYSSLFINSNGFLSFGSGSTDFTPTPGEMTSQMPRIAMTWCDLSPQNGGSVTIIIDQTTQLPLVKVDFQNTPEFGNGPNHTFNAQIDAVAGNVRIEHSNQNPAALFEMLCGISPGGIGSQPQKDLSGMNVSPVVGAPNESFYEWFGLTTMTYYTWPTSNPWDLVGVTLDFAAIGAGAPGAFYVGSAFP